MKRLLAVVLVVGCGSVQAGDVAQFFLGAGTAFMAHEAGHEVVGGSDIEWHGNNWECVRPCNASQIAAAGFVSQAVVSEVLASTFAEAEQRSFRNGLRAFNAIQSALYVIRNNKDLENFNDRDRRTARVLLILFSAYSVYRIEF